MKTGSKSTCANVHPSFDEFSVIVVHIAQVFLKLRIVHYLQEDLGSLSVFLHRVTSNTKFEHINISQLHHASLSVSSYFPVIRVKKLQNIEMCLDRSKTQ